MNKNLCIFCKSPSFGKGCPFSPSKVHFHVSDPNKCCFCGSVATGLGCPFNPHSKAHVKGIEFNSMVKETIDKSITLGYLMSSLAMPITDMEAYKLRIVNESGKRIKIPETNEEKAAYGPTEEYLITIKECLGKKIDMINSSVNMHLESEVSLDQYSKLYESTMNLKDEFSRIGRELNQTVVNAYQSGISRCVIEKLIIDSIIE